MAIKLTIKKFGNSLGIVFPREFVEKNHFKPGKKINVIITKEKRDLRKKKVDLREIFGTLKFKKPTQQIMREIDKELWPEE